MPQESDRSFVDQLGEKPLVRVLAYYVALAAATVLIARVRPEFLELINAQNYGVAGTAFTGTAPPSSTEVGFTHLKEIIAVTLAAVALMLPVAWICALTRSKQGYRQSLVQTLLILPVVVAGVVTIVRNSVALAFGLAGIVAAVSFRNRLEDSKDAVYIFLAIAVGVACGVQAVDLAAALSVTFTFLVVILWWTDFGRVPGALAGAPAQDRLRRALAMANRTHQFVSMVDQETLKSLGPEQLAQVANRVASRQAPFAGTLGGIEAPSQRPLRRLTVIVTDVSARGPIEEQLELHTKRWVFFSSTPAEGRGPGTFVLTYHVRPRKKIPETLLLSYLRTSAADRVREVTLEPESTA